MSLDTPIYIYTYMYMYMYIVFPGGSDGKESTCNAMQERWVQSLGWENLLEKGVATHSNILAWKTP